MAEWNGQHDSYYLLDKWQKFFAEAIFVVR